jgi:hypothetical protein
MTIVFKGLQPAPPKPVPVKKVEVRKPVARIIPIEIQGPQDGIVNKELTFSAANLSSSDADLEWSFGETGRIDSRLPNPKYRYASAGSYTVTLRVPNKPIASKLITIKGYSAPVASDCPSISRQELQSLFQAFVNASNDGLKAEAKKQLQKYFIKSNLENQIIDDHFPGSSGMSLNNWCKFVEYESISSVSIIGDPQKNPSNCIYNVHISSRK